MTLKELVPYLRFIQAASEGKPLQVNCSQTKDVLWFDIPIENVVINKSPAYYRIKPTPTLRPWTAEEVPIGALIRSLNRQANNNRYIISGASEKNMFIGCGNNVNYTFAVKGYEHSLDHGKTWLPCGIEVNK